MKNDNDAQVYAGVHKDAEKAMRRLKKQKKELEKQPEAFFSVDDTRKAIRSLERKAKKAEKENRRWRTMNPSFEKGDRVNITLPGTVIDVTDLPIITHIAVCLDACHKVVELFMPDKASSIKKL